MRGLVTPCAVPNCATPQYDRDNDSKLSFEEWVKYAEEDQDVSAFVNRMEHIIPRRDGDGTAAASASDRAPTVPATRA